jgi:putative Mg2+ transporter-C (MgtC) family protein
LTAIFAASPPVRTLGLVAFGSALAAVITFRFLATLPVSDDPGVTRGAVQGLVQGVLTGIGFIGAGVIIRSERIQRVQGLTTAAMVWLTAVMGLACGFGDWGIVVPAIVLVILLLVFGGPLERRIHRILGGNSDPGDQSHSG